MGNKYNRNFLTNVIVRVDFPNKLPLEDRLPPEVTKIILKSFPISEPKKIIGKEFKIKSAENIEVETNELKRTEWSFFGKNREKTLVVTPEALYISYNEYSSFEVLKSEFMGVVKRVFDDIKDVQINRIGLRYINEIELNEPNPTDWTLYLDEKLLSIFDLYEDRSKIAKGFSNLILNYGDMMLSFNYGMHNPDMPATIKKKVFILDYDAYYQGFLEIDEIEENLFKFHEEIENMFENNIKDSLRMIFNEQRN